jgi:hypothetical protein
MKKSAAIFLLAIFGIALSAGFTTAMATKMNGKCCTSSDGGRSYRYKMAMRLAATPRTCSAYAAMCIRHSGARTDRFEMCPAAQAQCVLTGVYVGPYSGRQFAGMQRQ